MPQVPRKCASLLLRSDTHEPDERDMRVLLLLTYWVVVRYYCYSYFILQYGFMVH